MFKSIERVVEAVRDFIDPKAVPGIVSDPMIELKLPARSNLGILIDIDASTSASMGSAGMAPMGLFNPFAGAIVPPIIKLKTVEDGQHSSRRISQETLQGILADFNDQMNLFGEVRYVPDPSSIPKEKA